MPAWASYLAEVRSVQGSLAFIPADSRSDMEARIGRLKRTGHCDGIVVVKGGILARYSREGLVSVAPVIGMNQPAPGAEVEAPQKTRKPRQQQSTKKKDAGGPTLF